MAVPCHIWSLLLFLLVDSPSEIFGAEESHQAVERLNTSTVEYLTVPSTDSSEHKGYIPNSIETSVTPSTIYGENSTQNFINAFLQTLRSQPWKTDLKKMTSEILQNFVIPVFNSSNFVWFYNETLIVIKTIQLYVSEEKLGWIYNATLNAVDAVIPPFNIASLREAYNETMNAVDTYFLSPKRVLYTALAVSVAMNPTFVSWFQAIIASLMGLVDNTLYVATGRGLSRSFWSAYPELRNPAYSGYSYQRSTNHTVSDTVTDVVYEVAAAVIERIGDLYL